MLEISPSYLNQIEHDVRRSPSPCCCGSPRRSVSTRRFFAAQDDTRLVAELREVTMDRDVDIDVDLAEIADMVGRIRPLARAIVNLHRRYRLTTTQLAAATEDRNSDGSGSGSITMPMRKCATTSTSGRTTCTKLDNRRRGSHHPDAHAPRRVGARAVRPADRVHGVQHRAAHRPRRYRAAPLRPGDQDPGDQRAPLVGADGVQDGRRTGLPRIRCADRQAGRRGQVHE